MGWSRRDIIATGCVLAGYGLVKYEVKEGLSSGENSPTRVDADSKKDPSEATTDTPPETPTESTTPIAPPDVSTTLSHDSTQPSKLHATVELTPPPGAKSLSISHSDLEKVESVDGLNPHNSVPRRYDWDGESSRCIVDLVVNTSQEVNEDFGGLDYAGTKEWIFAPRPDIRIWYEEGIQSIFSPYVNPFQDRDQDHVTLELLKGGYVGETSVYLGPYEEHEYSHKDDRVNEEETIQLIIPSHAKPSDPPADVFKAIEFVSNHLEVGTRYPELVIFVTTDPIRKGGRQMADFNSEREEVWVHESSTLNFPDSSWLHEYAHTRQSFRLAADMEWFREASAEYYAARLWWERYRAGTETIEEQLGVWDAGITVVRHLKPESTYESDKLTDQDSWTGPRTPYQKGGYVLLALDSLLQKESDKQVKLQEIFRWMNDSDDEIDYSNFIEKIHRISPLSEVKTQGWGARHISGPSVPPLSGWWSSIEEEVDKNPVGLPPVETVSK